jgi:tetratricopeptide (TPR) repeat protein
VAGKVIQFARNRRAVLRAMAKEYNVAVSPEIEAFFDAAEKGRWEEINERFKGLSKLIHSDNAPPELRRLWGPILETLGVEESAHSWPAQRLLDYGNSILDSLRPGMIYVGGTDPGRFIPTLLNETTDGERHTVLTQNAMADGNYLEYVRFLYGDQLATLTSEESKQAFQNYIEDAKARLAHDQQFPDEARQLRPGEQVQIADERVQVSGEVAVMLINELLLQMLMDKNADRTFALEESFPLRSTYTNASPLGPIMELRVQDEENALTAETAQQALDYWRSAGQQILSGTTADTPEGLNVLKTYSKMAASQGNLFAERDLNAEAEQAFRMGLQIYPDNPEATYGLANLWGGEGKVEEAKELVQAFEKKHPEDAKKPAWSWSATFRFRQ